MAAQSQALIMEVMEVTEFGTDFERIAESGDGLSVDCERRIKYDQEFWQEKLSE